MTNFDKVKKYYNDFDEKNRLFKTNSGRLEYEITMRILKEKLPEEATILDLGSGAGIYSFELAKQGYKVCLADLSEKLINQAREEQAINTNENIVSIDVVNALDLSIYPAEQFDVVLLFGPLYHLLGNEEREKCISEVNRVLKPAGLVFASFIPYLSGSIGILDRYFRHQEQVDEVNLEKVFNIGVFNNVSESGFQEGYYPRVEEIEGLFTEYGFSKKCVRSIRSIGYEKEDEIYSLENQDMFSKIMELINETSEEKAIVEMCGHAMYIGMKK